MGCLFVGLVVGVLTAARAEPIRISGRAMGTTWAVTFVQPASPLNVEEVSHRVARRLEVLEQQFSTYRNDSEISRFNASASIEWFPVSSEIAQVAFGSRRVSELTAGAYDVTVEPLLRLWGFAGERSAGNLPATSDLAAARRGVDWRKLEARAEPPALRRTEAGVRVDFSSMAKGFASDAVSELLASLGAAQNFVQIGGDVKTAGGRGESPWRVGVESPIAGRREIACVVALSGEALSTSGDYRNFFVKDGRRYGHIIDPRSGEPVCGDLGSVSVVAATCAQSSALATGLFVLGHERGMALAKREGIACVFFMRDGDRVRCATTDEFVKLIAARVGASRSGL